MDGLVGWSWFFGDAPTTPQEYINYVSAYFPDPNDQKSILNDFYPIDDFINASVAWYAMNGDVCVGCPSIYFLNDINVTNLYLYIYKTPAPPYLAGHASELPFIFDKPLYTSFWSEAWSANLSRNMMSGWTNFAKNGIPDITNPSNGHTIKWDSFNMNGQGIIFDNNIRINDNGPFINSFRNDACQFWLNQITRSQRQTVCFDSKSVSFFQ